MRVPAGLSSLVELGVIEHVVRPLMSGKEALVFLVVSGGNECIAKVYKQATARAFRNRAEYTEGRRTRNTRDQRAMSKRTSYGRGRDEDAWQSTEVGKMLRRLHRAGVRVPTPLRFGDGVVVMELIVDAEGDPAPRLGDVQLAPEAAAAVYDRLLQEVVRMLCAGVVHGDLSDFNVLMGAGGPVIIDLPQAVDASRNPHARKLLLRDVENLHRFLKRWVPGARIRRYAEEMWDLYERDALTPETVLAGDHVPSTRPADTGAVLDMIDDAEHDERRRREDRGLPTDRMRPPRRRSREAPRGKTAGPRARNVPKEAPAPKGPDAPGSRARVAAMMRAEEAARAAPKPAAAPVPEPKSQPPTKARPQPPRASGSSRRRRR